VQFSLHFFRLAWVRNPVTVNIFRHVFEPRLQSSDHRGQFSLNAWKFQFRRICCASYNLALPYTLWLKCNHRMNFLTCSGNTFLERRSKNVNDGFRPQCPPRPRKVKSTVSTCTGAETQDETTGSEIATREILKRTCLKIVRSLKK
jgi:hypothetical protein